MSPKEITKQVLDVPQRVERATQFLVHFTDLLEGRLDPFERTLSKLIIDEYISIFGELNNKRGK
jgi:hypothetical protein